ncbi:MAG: MFS transporter, partial [Anaerolineae bacterium]
MTTEPTTVEKLRALPYSYASNAALAVFVQLTFFGSVFVLFLDALGLDKAQIGFLLSLMPFTGVLSLFIAPTVARLGYKRVWITFFSARTAVTALLLLTPLVLAAYGSQSAMIFVSVVVLAFALLRAVGVYAGFPWIQEYVPDSLRGKYTATNNVFSTLAGFMAVSLASVVLARTAGLTGYTFLIAIGVIFGFISAGLATFIPGGAPVKQRDRDASETRTMREALRDGRFVRYLVGVGLFTLATVPLASFVPLYMQDEVGLDAAQVVLLTTGTMMGSLFSSYLWGWMADRFGGRPVVLYGLTIRMLLPLLWLLMPRHSAYSLPAALLIAAGLAVADVGWAVGASRLLYVSVVPRVKRAGYMALYWAWLGLAGGFSQLAGGRILSLTQGISGRVVMVPLDPYTPLFLMGMVMAGLAILVLRHIRDESRVGMGQFAGIFLRGNPILALESVLRFHLVKDEEATLRVTEKLGSAKSLLTVDELLEALADPRFNVRFEALISIGHMRSDERLTSALVEVLNGSEPALSVVAAWALGRMGDERAVIPLREALVTSTYR